jgi:hypothetical protein
MTSLSAQARPDSERAETYLRLQAEAALRTAAGLPRYKLPRELRFPGWLGGGSGRARGRIRRSVAMHRMHLARASSGTRGMPVRGHADAGSGVRQLITRARQPLRSAWSQVVFAVWRGTRRLTRRFARAHRPPPARECLRRVGTLACVLTGAGGIDDSTADAVVEDFRASLAARSLIDPRELLGDARRATRPVQARPTGQLLVVPVGVAVDGDIDGEPARFYLSTVIVDQRQASIAFSARFPPALMHVVAAMPPVMRALQACTATDDRGARYQLHPGGGGGGGGTFDGRLDVRPALPAGVKWIDVALPGAQLSRISLTARPPALPSMSVALPAGEAAERYIDHLTFSLLQRDESATPGSAAADLVAAGLVETSSPALGRLAAAAGHAGFAMPPDLASVRPGTLPADWLAMMARRDRRDGPAGAIPLAARLPEIEGTRCFLVGLVSEPDSATLHVHARGWPQPHRTVMFQVEPFRWSARDDLGCSYVAEPRGSSHGHDRADLRLRLRPAIDPQARELQIILTGKTAEVSVTVPLDWQEGP